MKRFCAILFQLLIVYEVPAQINKFGVPVITNYNTEVTNSSEQIWCITKDKSGNIYFGTQERGVTRYDGTRWTNIRIADNPRVFSLASDNRGIVYVGAAFEFGYIQPDHNGTSQYVSLAERIDSIPEIRNILFIVVHKDKVYFQSQKNTYVYDIQSDSLSKINLPRFNVLNAFHLAKAGDRLILSDNSFGMFELHDTSVSPLPGGDFFKRKSCTVILPYNDTQLLVGTFDDGLFIYDIVSGNVNTSFIDPSLNERLKNAKIYSGTKLEKDMYAIGTTNKEGILILSKTGELIEQITTDNSDLEDNTMYALYFDNKYTTELWMVNFGSVSKAYLFIKTFTAKQGVESAANRICKFQGSYYISTDAGILKSQAGENNNLVFREMEGIETQVFPLKIMKTGNKEILLAGSTFGILQVKQDGTVSDLITDLISDGIIGLSEMYITSREIRMITQSAIDQDIVYFGKGLNGVVILRYNEGHWYFVNKIKDISGSVEDIIENEKGDLWILTDDPTGLYNLTFHGNDTILSKLGPDDGVPEVDLNSLALIDNELYVTTSKGIIRYDKTSGKFMADNSLTDGYSEDKNVLNLYLDDDGDLWYSGSDGKYAEVLFRNDGNRKLKYHGLLNLLPNAGLQDIKEFEERLFLLKSRIIYVVDKSDLITDTTKVNTYFVRIIAGTDSTLINGSFYDTIDDTRRIPSGISNNTNVPEFPYDMNEISLEWTTPYFLEELSTEYSYKLEGLEKSWSGWEGFSPGKYAKKEYNSLPDGRYTFRVKTRTLTGLTSDELYFDFIILKPWYKTFLATVSYFIAVILLITGIIKAYTWRLKKENIRLENIVEERTSEVNSQKRIIEEKNKKITESIHYSKHIQDSILIKQDEIDRIVPGSFVYLKPRDIVSGDFYWFTQRGDVSVVAAVDCTGHGVPGAFMCMIGNMLLNFIVKEKGIIKPSEILNNLNAEVIKALQQERKDSISQDGMDISVCTIDFRNDILQYAGAKNPLYIVNNNDLVVFEADPYSIGGTHLSRKNTKPPDFRNQTINLIRGSSIYLFTDGYIDQFGGADNKSFNITRFIELLKSISILQPEEQYKILDRTMKEWMNSARQIDDMLVIGIKL